MAHNLLANAFVRDCARILMLMVGPALSGCIIDTVPLPELEHEQGNEPPAFDGSRNSGQSAIHVDALYWTDTPAILVGAEWSVPALLHVAVRNPDRSHWQGGTESASDGSFNLPLNASVGDRIEISVSSGEVEIDTAEVRLVPSSVAANEANDDIEAAYDDGLSGGFDPSSSVGVGPPDIAGVVTVSAPSDTVAYGIAVVVANLDGGVSTVTFANADGSFIARLAAASGDELSIFAVEPASSNGGGAPIHAFVP